MKAIDHVVKQFLEQHSTKPKVVINLGCGYDPLPWQCLSRYPDVCRNVKFVDIDYPELMRKKKQMVQSTEELVSVLTNLKPDADGDVILQSDQYLQLGCDLRDLKRLESTLEKAVDINNCSVLFTAEVSITYMNVDAADALVRWASTLHEAQFCLLEQLMPGGQDHPFARTMMAHFNKLGTPLEPVTKYPTTSLQEIRFLERG